MSQLRWSTRHGVRATMAESRRADGYHSITVPRATDRHGKTPASVILAGPPALYPRPVRLNTVLEAMREAQYREDHGARRA